MVDHDAFHIARETPVPDLSSYGAKHGPQGCDPAKWEQDLLDYLGMLNAVADHALRYAIATWWNLPDMEPLPEDATDKDHQEAEIKRFGSVGIEIVKLPASLPGASNARSVSHT